MAGFLGKVFGKSGSKQQPAQFTVERDDRIPIQVYEAINQPVKRRQQWAIYIGIVLLVIVLAITMTQRHNRRQTAKTTVSPVEQVQQKPDTSVEQTDQQTTPAPTAVSGSTNNSIVSQPQ